MLSAALSAQQYISDMSLLEQNLELGQLLFTTSPLSDLVDHDTQSLPSMMSPNSSTKDLSDSVDDDDDDVDYESFAVSSARRMAHENALPLSVMQLQHPQPPVHPSYTSAFDYMYPELHFLPFQQPLNVLPLQQPLSWPVSGIISSNPSMTPYGPFGFTASTLECDSPVLKCHRYFDSLEQQPLQRPIHQDVATLDHGLNLLVVPRLEGNVNNTNSLPQLKSPSASPLARSPTVSWASISRETSPACTPAPIVLRPTARSAKRPTQCRSGATTPANSEADAQDASSLEEAASPTLSVSHCQLHGDASSSSPVKRKRRARQAKIKVKPTIFECDAPGCGKVFSRAYNLTSHLKTHSSERPFKCGSCSLAFARRHDRERHLRLHTGEKPYTCNSCGFGFMRNDALHRHQRICGQSPAAWMALLQQQQRPNEVGAEQESTMGHEDISL
ncbi:MAG: hypothetical protein J3Q66DRAFT_326829 [Benniella sp.]|nr:MAG: hypothetical protein J3Q66DRAFT_326829 [Benniella sp.]